MKWVAVFAAVALMITTRGAPAQTRNAVRVGGVASGTPCFSLDAEDEEDAPGPQGTLPDDEQGMPVPPPPSTEPTPPDDDLPSEPAAAPTPAVTPAPPAAAL